jgi:hypothetical protein
MRAFLIVVAACGGTTSSAAPPPALAPDTPSPRVVRRASIPEGPVDPIAALAQPRVETGWVVPGPTQLVLGGTSLQPLDEKPLEVDLLEERGGEIRVGVRLDHARFALWVARSRLLGVIAREQNVSESPTEQVVTDSMPSVTLRAGARVYPVAYKSGFTRVRYLGSLEVEGWVPSAAVADRGPAGHATGRRFGGRKPLLVQTGATIRTDKRWGARALAVAHYSMFVQIIEVLDDGWNKVGYADADVAVTGFVSRRDPPSRTHRARDSDPPTPLLTNITVPADTCLYASDDPIGFVVGDQAAAIEPSPRVGWFTLTLDTPWGAVPFEARGPAETALAKCPSPNP